MGVKPTPPIFGQATKLAFEAAVVSNSNGTTANARRAELAAATEADLLAENGLIRDDLQQCSSARMEALSYLAMYSALSYQPSLAALPTAFIVQPWNDLLTVDRETPASR